MVKNVLFPLVTCVFTLSYFATSDDKIPKTVNIKDEVVIAHVATMKELAVEYAKEKPDKATLAKLGKEAQDSAEEMVTTISKALDIGMPTTSASTLDKGVYGFKSFYSKEVKETFEVTEVVTTFQLGKDDKPTTKDHPVALKKMVFKKETFQKLQDLEAKLEEELPSLLEDAKKRAAEIGEDKEKLAALKKEIDEKVAELLKPAKVLIEALHAEVRTQVAQYGVTKDSKLFQAESDGEVLPLIFVTPSKNPGEVDLVTFVLGLMTEKGKVKGLRITVNLSTKKLEAKPAPRKD